MQRHLMGLSMSVCCVFHDIVTRVTLGHIAARMTSGTTVAFYTIYHSCFGCPADVITRDVAERSPF
jgi:hypothetical protein